VDSLFDEPQFGGHRFTVGLRCNVSTQPLSRFREAVDACLQIGCIVGFLEHLQACGVYENLRATTGSLLSTFHLSNPPARLFADRQARQRPNTLIVFADEAKAPEKSQLMLPGYSGGNSIALTLRGSTRRPGDRLLLPCSSISTHSVLSRTVWSEAKKPLSDLRGAAQRDLGHGSMPTGCILYAVNSFFAGVLGMERISEILNENFSVVMTAS
jgi:hypothetical protein